MKQISLYVGIGSCGQVQDLGGPKGQKGLRQVQNAVLGLGTYLDMVWLGYFELFVEPKPQPRRPCACGYRNGLRYVLSLLYVFN